MEGSSSLFPNPAAWQDLHAPLLEMILNRLSIPDYLRFASVCRSWRDVHRSNHHCPNPRHQDLMLWLVSLNDKLFYNLSEKRYYRISLPKETNGKHCCGISHGWLLFVDDLSRSEKTPNNNMSSSPSLLLVNPFTGSKIDIPIRRRMLPSFYRVTHFNPAIGLLSTVPSNPDFLVLFGQQSNRPMRQFFYHARNKTWTALRTNHIPLYEPVYCGGGFYWLLESFGKLVLVESLVVAPTAKCIDIDLGLPGDGYFLVESDGRLLLTVFVMGLGIRIRDLEVFEVDLLQRVLVKLESLGDRVLFYNLSNYSCFSMSAAETGGPGNRIYMTGLTSLFDMSLDYQGQLWIEYDYASHEIINTKLPHMMHGMLRWIVPNLW